MTVSWSTIELSSPLDLAESLEGGQAFRWRRHEDEEAGDYLEGVIFRNLVCIKQAGDTLRFTSGPDPETSFLPLLEDYLGLNHDLEAAYAELQLDERIGRSISAFPGLRILRQEPWECVVAFICSANNNIARISRNVEDIANAFGEPISNADTDRRSFPSPAAVADAGEKALRELGLGFRAKYVAAASRRVADADIDLYSLREMPYEEALESITSLAGVGDKVGNCILLFSMDKFEAFPVDVWIDRALRDWYFTDETSKAMPRTRMRAWAQERFGRFSGYANQYLFHSRRLQGSGQAESS